MTAQPKLTNRQRHLLHLANLLEKESPPMEVLARYFGGAAEAEAIFHGAPCKEWQIDMLVKLVVDPDLLRTRDAPGLVPVHQALGCSPAPVAMADPGAAALPPALGLGHLVWVSDTTVTVHGVPYRIGKRLGWLLAHFLHHPAQPVTVREIKGLYTQQGVKPPGRGGLQSQVRELRSKLERWKPGIMIETLHGASAYQLVACE